MSAFYSREATSQVAVLARIFGGAERPVDVRLAPTGTTCRCREGAGCPVDIRLAPTEAKRRQIPQCLHRCKFDAPYACIGVFDSEDYVRECHEPIMNLLEEDTFESMIEIRMAAPLATITVREDSEGAGSFEMKYSMWQLLENE